MNVCAILLSYQRPQNMARIIDETLRAPSVGRIIVSNNNPDIDLRQWVDFGDSRISLLQQTSHCSPAKRFALALEEDAGHFLCLDDDLFLRGEQIQYLLDRLAQRPERIHGMYGQLRRAANAGFQSGIHAINREVDVLNRSYFFTRQHLDRMSGLGRALGFSDLTQAEMADDVLLSFSGEGKPLCHAIGPFEDCPTSHDPDIAVFMRHGFDPFREAVYQQLCRLTGRE